MGYIDAATLEAGGLLPLAGKLVLAALLGGLVGWEREAHGQAAGLRTNIIVAMSGCLIMVMSTGMDGLYRAFGAESVMRLDPSRMAAYTIAGMGFLGAGAIIKGRSSVRGLTTAASLWLVNGVGLAVGAGFYIPAIIVTTISMVILTGLGLKLFRPSRRIMHTVLTITCRCKLSTLKDIREILESHKDVRISSINYAKDVTEGRNTYRIRIDSGHDLPRRDIMGQFMELEGIEHFSWDEANVP